MLLLSIPPTFMSLTCGKFWKYSMPFNIVIITITYQMLQGWVGGWILNKLPICGHRGPEMNPGNQV